MASAPALSPAEPPPRLPRKCAELLAEASAQDRRATEAARRVRIAEAQERKWRAKREEEERVAEEAVRSAKGRRLEAERRLEEVRAAQRQAEADQARLLSDEEAGCHAFVIAVQDQVAEVRKAADERARGIRQEVAAQRERADREIAELRARFEERRLGLDREVADHSANCKEAVHEADRRRKEAEKEAGKACREKEEQIEAAHADADGQVKQHERGCEDAVAEANRQLAELEEALEGELLACARQEQAAREDHSAEDEAAAHCATAAEAIRRRRAECGELARRCDGEVAKLVEQVVAAGAAAASRVYAVQESADREVDMVRAEMETFAVGDHQEKILELQAKLKGAFEAAKGGLSMELARLQAEAARQAHEAGTVLVVADRRVETLRADVNARIDERIQAVHDGMRSIQEEQDGVLADAEVRFRATQEQMVRYVVSQQEEMLEALKATPEPAVPLMLSLSPEA